MIEKTDKVVCTVDELVQLCELCVLTDRKAKNVNCEELVKNALRYEPGCVVRLAKTE